MFYLPVVPKMQQIRPQLYYFSLPYDRDERLEIIEDLPSSITKI